MKKFEIKTACGYLKDIPAGVCCIIYKPDHSTRDVAETTYIFGKDSFFIDFLGGYDGRGCMLHKNGHIQSFHWIDRDGREYRPKASKAIERYMVEAFEVAPTLADLFDYVGRDYTDFDTTVEKWYSYFTGKCERDDGAFGRALEVAIKEVATPRSKYKNRVSPAGKADLTLRINFDDLSDWLGL